MLTRPARSSARPAHVRRYCSCRVLWWRRLWGLATRVALRQLVSAKSAVLGEPVIATIVLDTTVGVDGFEWVQAPSFPGCLHEASASAHAGCAASSLCPLK